jgi:hypothetical protein
MYLTRKVLIGLSLCWLILFAEAGIGQYRFDTWTTDNGLPLNGVSKIAQSPEG